MSGETCQRGHPRTPENTRLSQGYRLCRVCHNEDNRKVRRMRRLRPKAPPTPEQAQGYEVWRLAVGFEQWVAASTHGRFRSIRTGRLLSRQLRADSNCTVSIRKFNSKITLTAASVLLRTFVERVAGPEEIAIFLDGDRANLTLGNLRWGKRPGRPKAPKVVRAIRPPAPALGEKLRARLSENEIYAAANRAVSKSLPGYVRDDVISDILVAVLSGELAVEDIAAQADTFRKAHNRVNEVGKHRSIDDPNIAWRI